MEEVGDVWDMDPFAALAAGGEDVGGDRRVCSDASASQEECGQSKDDAARNGMPPQKDRAQSREGAKEYTQRMQHRSSLRLSGFARDSLTPTPQSPALD